MKKLTFFTLLSFLLLLILTTQDRTTAQESKHVIGFGVGRVAYSDNVVYVNYNNEDYWFKYNQDIILNLSYAYKVYPYFRIGTYLEYEKAKMESSLVKDAKGSRFDVGVHWLGEYPNTQLRLQLGGYFASSFLSNERWDEKPMGLNYGIIAGPCFESGKIGIALHIHAGLSPYFGDKSPEDVDILAPKVILKVYYTL